MISKVRPQRIAARFAVVVAAAAALYAPVSFKAAQSDAQKTSARPTLDYEFFKTRVEPIYLKARSADHVRCIVCHVKTRHPRGMSLEPLSPGSDSWTEEQSRRNFVTVSKLVVPGNVNVSMFPNHPLAPEAGGDAREVHSGGRQFESSDPDYKTIAEWINGKKAEGSSAP